VAWRNPENALLHLVALISGLFCPFRWVPGNSVQHGCDTDSGNFGWINGTDDRAKRFAIWQPSRP